MMNWSIIFYDFDLDRYIEKLRKFEAVEEMLENVTASQSIVKNI